MSGAARGGGSVRAGRGGLEVLLTANGADVAYLYNAFDTRFDNLAVGCILALAADSPRVASAAEAPAKRVW